MLRQRAAILRSIAAWLYRSYLVAPGWLRAALKPIGPAPRRYLRQFALSRYAAVSTDTHKPRRGIDDNQSSPTCGAMSVSVLGYLGGQFGVGENMRSLAKSLSIAGVPHELCDVRWAVSGSRGPDAVDAPRSREPNCPIHIYCVNADQMSLVSVVYGRALAKAQYRIGYWYWELSRFPDAWQSALALVDEIWVGSRYTQEAISAVSLKPVVYMPPAIDVKTARSYSRADFGLPPDAFLFLFSFDLNSHVERKNPQACIEAFLRSFSGRPELPVGLVLKCMHGSTHPDAYTAISTLARKDARIHIRDLVLSRADAYGLLSVCDCFVSLHRAEGFGFGMAEAMFLGKPVIATGYSGNTDFTKFDNASLVRYRLVAVAEGAYPCEAGQVWAEPDIEDAAVQMRAIYSDQAFRERLAGAGRRYIIENFSPEVIAERVSGRLEHVRQHLLYRSSSKVVPKRDLRK